MTNTISKVIRNGTEYEFSANNGGVTSVNTQTGAVTVNDIKVAASAPASPTEGMAWYDTTNDVLKTYDGSNWGEINGNTKTFYLSSTSDTTTGQAICDWYINNKNPIVIYGNRAHILYNVLTNKLIFRSTSSSYSGNCEIATLTINISSGGTVTSIETGTDTINGVPAVGTNGQVLTVVSGAAAWANAPASGIQNDTTGTTTTVSAIRAGTEAEYALITPNANTIYHIY